jgi:hypothetical protein
MGKNSKKVNSLKVIQGGKAELVGSTKALTHADVKEFFAKFAEAILVDQKRVNKLPQEAFHPFYDDGMWQRNRDDHIGAIIELSMTVDEMPESLLTRLTELAVVYRPEAVKQSLLNMISDLATGVASPWLYETASLLFCELIKDVSQKDHGISTRGNAMEAMFKWFDYDDPIAIARDSEWEYVDLLASHIESESEKTRRALAARSRLAFSKMIAGREICNRLFSEPRDT